MNLPMSLATFNLYLGADLQPLFAALTPGELAERAQQVWLAVLAGDPAARMRAAAGVIAQAGPDVLAVQEAVRWTASSPDGEVTTLIDQLELLLSSLADLGLEYQVAARAASFSSESLPVTIPGLDARTLALADASALLVRNDSELTVTATAGGRYSRALRLSLLGSELELVRGWCSLDLAHNGRPLRVVATHLEAFEAEVRVAQARQLLEVAVRAGDPAAGPPEGLATVVLGDLNCRAPGERGISGGGGNDSQSAAGDAYEVLRDNGFRDAWLVVAERGASNLALRAGNAAGATCRAESSLSDPAAGFDHRIDLVFSSPSLRPITARVLGDLAADRTAAGVWPSDHGCLVVEFD